MNDVSSNEIRDKQVSSVKEALKRERYELLHRLDDWLDKPMLLLALLWLGLIVVELIWGNVPAFEMIVTIIWIIFVIDFALEFVLAPDKGVYLKSNWLIAISILMPALRTFRAFQMFRLLRLANAGRGLRLLRLVSSLNRGMRALGASLSRRGFSYVLVLTFLVICAGAAGMYSFEKGIHGGLHSYGEALWWTAMVMTTLGSQYWPQTGEGRILCVFLSLYAVAVFSFVTASLATFFVGRDAENDEAELAGAKELAILRAEVIALRDDIRALSRPPKDI
jgi:voltage-gated potassium channel